jgi:hypothetical protein
MLQGGRYRALHAQHSCESKRLIQQQKWRGPSNTRLARALFGILTLTGASAWETGMVRY